MEKIYERVFAERAHGTGIIIPLSDGYVNKIKDIFNTYGNDDNSAEEFTKDVVDSLISKGIDAKYVDAPMYYQIQLRDVAKRDYPTIDEMQTMEDAIVEASKTYPNVRFMPQGGDLCNIYKDETNINVFDKIEGGRYYGKMDFGLSELLEYNKEAAIAIFAIYDDIENVVNTIIDSMFSNSLNPVNELSIVRDEKDELFVKIYVKAKQQNGYQENKKKIYELDKILSEEF